MSETGTYIDNDQFDGGSTMKCGYDIEAMLALSTAPGAPNPHSAADIAALANSDYVRFVGPDVYSDQQGMFQPGLHQVLDSHSLKYQDISTDWGTIRSWVNQGYPVVLCVWEGEVYDLELGSNPYPWDTTGYQHIMLVSGLNGNNCLFRDTANIAAPNALRPGPRTYDISRMSPLWATVVTPSWLQGEQIVIDLSNAQVASFFKGIDPGKWQCSNGHFVWGDMLNKYQRWGNSDLCGLSHLGLPLTEETNVTDAHGQWLYSFQVFERGILIKDPHHLNDNPPGAGDIYAGHIDSGPGFDVLTKTLKAQITQLQQQITQLQAEVKVDPAQLQTLQAQVNGYKQALQTIINTIQPLAK